MPTLIMREMVLQPAPPHPTATILAVACCNTCLSSSSLNFVGGKIFVFAGSEMPGFKEFAGSNPVSGLNSPNPSFFNRFPLDHLRSSFQPCVI
jgi:hypothetical protein